MPTATRAPESIEQLQVGSPGCSKTGDDHATASAGGTGGPFPLLIGVGRLPRRGVVGVWAVPRTARRSEVLHATPPSPARRPPFAPADSPALLLAWSYSRHRLLATCERAVFWSCWGWRGLGLDPDGPTSAATARRAFALKQLTALPLLIGTAVHSAARELVSAVRARQARPTYDDVLTGARLTLNQVRRSSQPD